ncbi:DUF1002 domain-containing protein (plasmid) [Clostridium perfringens]
MRKNNLKKLAFAITLVCSMNMTSTVFAKGHTLIGEYPKGEILSFGASLNKQQEADLRKYFGAPSDIDATYVTTEVAVKQLGLPESAIKTYKGGWYSSAYVKLNDKKTGVNVKANNLTLVTDDMLANALITSGILNADVIASAPFKVTGESALAGILAGAEEILGTELSQENKETAQKEIETTLDLADEIGQKEASSIINDIKAEVIKDSPTTNVQIENIVVNIANNYNVNLSPESKAKVVSLMSDVNKLDINYKDIKATLEKATEKFREDMKALGKEIKESGIFEKMWNWVKNLWNSFLDLFRNESVENIENETSVSGNDSIDDTNNEKNNNEDNFINEEEQSSSLGESNVDGSVNKEESSLGETEIQEGVNSESVDTSKDNVGDSKDDNSVVNQKESDDETNDKEVNNNVTTE